MVNERKSSVLLSELAFPGQRVNRTELQLARFLVTIRCSEQ